MNDKIIAIKIKVAENQYTEIPITALAQNVYWNSNSNLNLKQHIIGEIILDDNNDIIPLQEQINHLNDNKADIDSPTFIGTPKIKINNKDQNIATETYVDNQTENQLTINNLIDAGREINISKIENISQDSGRNYPITKNQNGYLSVNVPWSDTIKDSLEVTKIWTGSCETESEESVKKIRLDDDDNFPQLLSGGEIVAIYFKNENIQNGPQLEIKQKKYNIHFLEENNFKFSPGLKFFVYSNNNWILSSVEYNYLEKKADLDSPIFIGTPKIIKKENNIQESQDIATKKDIITAVNSKVLEQNNFIKKEDFVQTNLFSVPPTSFANRQYEVVFDSKNKLSVNVPWLDPSDTIKNVQNLWNGFCDTGINTAEKTITFHNDEYDTGYGGLIANSTNDISTTNPTILIYFKYGNNVKSPKIRIANGDNTYLDKDILYQNGVNSYAVLDENSDSLYYQWGPGVKTFTYIEYIDNNNEEKNGWLINSFDKLTIKILDDKKANLESPNFSGSPTVQTPPQDEQNDKRVVNIEYVKQADSQILKTNESYLIHLPGVNNSNKDIFTVDWDGKVNNVNLDCISTKEIKKFGNENQTIIGKYNLITSSPGNLKCQSEQLKCDLDILVGSGVGVVQSSGNYAFAIGNGVEGARSNCFDITWNGDIQTSARLLFNRSNIILGNRPSIDYQSKALILYDAKQKALGSLGYWYGDHNESGIIISAERKEGSNFLKILKEVNGDDLIKVSSPKAWRRALQLSNILDFVRVVEFTQGNFELNGNSSSVFVLDYFVPKGFSYLGILTVRIDGNSPTESAQNYNNCFASNTWIGSDEKIHTYIKNTGSTSAKITVHVHVLFKRTSLL